MWCPAAPSWASLCLLLSERCLARVRAAMHPASSLMHHGHSCGSTKTFVKQHSSFAALNSFSFELMETRTAFMETRTGRGVVFAHSTRQNNALRVI
jgi:hypothetical protein